MRHFARGDFDSADQLFDNLYKDYWVDASANLVAGRHRAWALLRLGRIEEGQLQINDLVGRTDDAQFNGHVRLLRALVAQIGGSEPLDTDLPLPGEIGSSPDRVGGVPLGWGRSRASLRDPADGVQTTPAPI